MDAFANTPNKVREKDFYSMKDALLLFLAACGVAGIFDVLWMKGIIGVWLSKYLDLRSLFKK